MTLKQCGIHIPTDYQITGNKNGPVQTANFAEIHEPFNR